MAKKLAAECLGTFALVFAGTGAVVIDEVSGGGVSHVGIALTFGLIVLAMIYTLGDISGAHINPAVTIGFWAARRFESREVLPYVVSQCAGAFLASTTAPQAMNRPSTSDRLWPASASRASEWVIRPAMVSATTKPMFSVAPTAKARPKSLGAWLWPPGPWW